jgi:hypothetical protein
MSVKKRAAKRPTQLTVPYRKARRQLTLFSGILLAWELVGVKVDPEIKSHIDFTLLNPEAIPYVLITIVVYLIYRLNVEWLMCGKTLRNSKVPKTDFVVALIIAGTSLGIFLIQKSMDTRIADLIGAVIANVLLSSAAVFAVLVAIATHRTVDSPKSRFSRVVVLTLVLLAGLCLLTFIGNLIFAERWVLYFSVGYLAGVTFIAILKYSLFSETVALLWVAPAFKEDNELENGNTDSPQT